MKKLFGRKDKSMVEEPVIAEMDFPDLDIDPLPETKKGWKDYLTDPRSKLNMPMPLYALFTLKTEKDRIEYLKGLPVGSLNSVAAAVFYIMLKANVLEKAIKLGIDVPGNIITFYRDIEKKVKDKGELTINNVKSTIETVKNTALMILGISFFVMVILNPLILASILPALAVIEFVLFFTPSPSGKK